MKNLSEGEKIERALSEIRTKWLPNKDRSSAAIDSNQSFKHLTAAASALATTDVADGTSKKAQQERLRYYQHLLEVVTTLESRPLPDTMTDHLSPSRLVESVEAIDPRTEAAASQLVILASTTAVLGTITAFHARYGTCPDEIENRVQEALDSVEHNSYDAVLPHSATAAEELADRIPFVCRVEEILPKLDSLAVPTYADLLSIKRSLRDAIDSADTDQLNTIETRIATAPDAEWTEEDLLAPSPEDFERLIADLWQAASETGDVAKTRRSNDGGIDVIAQFDTGQVAVIQVKQTAPDRRIGRPVVQQTNGAMSQFEADQAYVVTSADFTQQAHTAAASLDRMHLVAEEQLLDLLESSPLIPPRSLR